MDDYNYYTEVNTSSSENQTLSLKEYIELCSERFVEELESPLCRARLYNYIHRVKKRYTDDLHIEFPLSDSSDYSDSSVDASVTESDKSFSKDDYSRKFFSPQQISQPNHYSNPIQVPNYSDYNFPPQEVQEATLPPPYVRYTSPRIRHKRRSRSNNKTSHSSDTNTKNTAPFYNNNLESSRVVYLHNTPDYPHKTSPSRKEIDTFAQPGKFDFFYPNDTPTAKEHNKIPSTTPYQTNNEVINTPFIHSIPTAPSPSPNKIEKPRASKPSISTQLSGVNFSNINSNNLMLTSLLQSCKNWSQLEALTQGLSVEQKRKIIDLLKKGRGGFISTSPDWKIQQYINNSHQNIDPSIILNQKYIPPDD